MNVLQPGQESVGGAAPSRTWRLNATLLDMVRRAFLMLDEAGLTFDGLPPTLDHSDALQTLDGLALAAHEAVERHGDQLPPDSVAALRSAIDILWRASTLSAKIRKIAASRGGPTMNDVAEVALLAGEAAAVMENRSAAGFDGAATDWSAKIAEARAARAARVRVNWERQILEQCQEKVAQTPRIDSSVLAANICAHNGLSGSTRKQVTDLIVHWRRSGALSACDGRK